MIEVYTDGGNRNTGNVLGGSVKKTDKSAWAFYVKGENFTFQDARGFYGYTNNQMELSGFISALKYLKAQNLNEEKITFYLDSKYVLEGVTKWLPGWVKRNYRNSSNKPIKNPEYWQAIVALLPEFPNLHFVWVKGHDNNQGNLLVDQLLNEAMDKL